MDHVSIITDCRIGYWTEVYDEPPHALRLRFVRKLVFAYADYNPFHEMPHAPDQWQLLVRKDEMRTLRIFYGFEQPPPPREDDVRAQDLLAGLLVPGPRVAVRAKDVNSRTR